MDYPQRRLPALEDQPGYLLICAAHRTTPIERPAGSLAYGPPSLADDPALGFPLSDLDPAAAAFVALRRAQHNR